jgi:phage baseplate assembly protein W
MTTYLGSTLPLRRGNRGYFESTNDPLINEKSKFINLILTKKGERVGVPRFGCDLWKLLFEQKDESIQELSREYITSAVEEFMPYLKLLRIEILNLDTFVNDNNIQLYVAYSFENNPLVSEEVLVELNASPSGGLFVSGRTISRD